MLVLPVKGQKHGSIAAAEQVETITPDVHGDEVKKEITARLLEKVASLPKARRKKILAIRYQLDAGKYRIDERLNVATDRLIENLITKGIEENEAKSTRRHRQK
jgi:anti-sigma28 factor (negative regulator of flagellin synthesis)